MSESPRVNRESIEAAQVAIKDLRARYKASRAPAADAARHGDIAALGQLVDLIAAQALARNAVDLRVSTRLRELIERIIAELEGMSRPIRIKPVKP